MCVAIKNCIMKAWLNSRTDEERQVFIAGAADGGLVEMGTHV